MLIICTTSRPFERLKFTTITTSANRNSCVSVIPIIFPFGSILLKFINLRFRFYSTPTKLYFQLKIIAKYFLQEFSIISFSFWSKLLSLKQAPGLKQKLFTEADSIKSIQSLTSRFATKEALIRMCSECNGQKEGACCLDKT